MTNRLPRIGERREISTQEGEGLGWDEETEGKDENGGFLLLCTSGYDGVHKRECRWAEIFFFSIEIGLDGRENKTNREKKTIQTFMERIEG